MTADRVSAAGATVAPARIGWRESADTQPVSSTEREAPVSKFVHYAPLNLASTVRANGLKKSHGTHRAAGVYAVRCLGLPPTATRAWRRALKSESRFTRLAAVMFEIDHDELVHCFEESWDNIERGIRTLSPARHGQALACALTRKPYFEFSFMEVVVPRGIGPSEIVRIVEPCGKRRTTERAERRPDERPG